ncbi:MAG: indole-3-glycerol phosphate synthase TrpC [Candidatus Korobacteraceae bacterium]
MPIGLDHIVASTRARLAQSPLNTRELERRAAAHQPRGFGAALRRASAERIAVIAELKKASPSRGQIRADFPVADLAHQLEVGGAAALSVLTDEDFFQGSMENLAMASHSVELPCLRKDFMVEEAQLLEARAGGADAILLIVAALNDEELKRLHRRALELELDVLCEVHDEQELTRAIDAGCEIVGVNSRDLRTFHVDLKTAVRLGELLPKTAVRVAESGIHTGADMRRLREVGYDAFLIGESLMKTESPGKALAQLLAEAGQKPASLASPAPGV